MTLILSSPLTAASFFNACAVRCACQADNSLAGVIRRADVAALVVKALDDPATIKKTFSALDPSLKTPAA
jgi:hypothetical protein